MLDFFHQNEHCSKWRETNIQAIFETLFAIVYLITVVALGILMIRGSNGRRQYFLYGMMAVILGCGNAFHLVPRAIALCTTGLDHYTAALGIGKKNLTIAVWGLALCPIILCLMPQNAWLSREAPQSWGIYRNIPFVILGVLIVILFYNSAKNAQDLPFRFLWLAVVISFACHIPVVLFANIVPAVGMLMIPKTCAYVWVVLIGYQTIKGNQ